jgi:hypothetical protein
VIEPAWPGLAELCSGVASRLEAGLAEMGEVMAEVIRSIMSS